MSKARTLVERIDDLRSVVKRASQERPFRIDAFVVLPDHLHAVWTLPPGDNDYTGRWRLIKSRFTHALVKPGLGLSRNGLETEGDYGE